MSSTPLNAVRSAADPPDLPDPDRLSDWIDARRAPLLPSDDTSSAMDTSGLVYTSLVHNDATLGPSLTVVPPVSSSTPSYKDKLLVSGSSGSQPADVDLVDDEEYGHGKDIFPSSISAVNSPPSVTPVAPIAPSVSEAFGPWMLVERRQRRSSCKAPSYTVASPVSSPPPIVVHGSRFNPIFKESLDMDHVPIDTTGPQSHTPMPISQSAAVVTLAVVSSSIDASSATVVVPSTSKSSVSQAHGKEKSKVSAKQGDPSKHLALPLRKPIDVQRSAATPTSKPTALTNHRSSSLSSARFAPFPRPSSRFNKANHTAVVVDENANPNVHSPTLNPPSLLPTASGSVPAVPIVSCEMVSRPKDSEGSIPAGTLRDKHPKFINAVKQYIRDYKSSLVGIVEPRISGARADSVIATLGFLYSHRIEAAGFSGGLWLCWQDSIQIDVLVHHFQFMHCRVTCLSTGSSSLVTLVYASPSVPKRKALWPHLRSLACSIREPWLLMGDFNATLEASERKGGADAVRPSRDFQSFLFDCSLRDLGYQGSDFTWSRGATLARLDRMLCNAYWDESFPESAVSHLFRMHSDHRPLLLTIGPPLGPSPPRQFRYFSGWLSHTDFQRMVQDNWKPMLE
ncbi:hypothetical protein V6N13_050748 [Hibiscus sabdariffa]